MGKTELENEKDGHSVVPKMHSTLAAVRAQNNPQMMWRLKV